MAASNKTLQRRIIRKSIVGARIDADVATLMQRRGSRALLDGLRSDRLWKRELSHFVQGITKDVLRQRNPLLAKVRNRDAGFIRRYRKAWREAFHIAEVFVAVSCEVGSAVNQAERHRAQREQDAKFEALIRNHARACRVASEILCLATNGYPSAALARWRTLHEIVATALFLSKHDMELSRRYLLSDIIDSEKSASAHDMHAAKLKCVRPTSHELHQLKKLRADLQTQYYKEFGKDYGWAKDHLQGAALTFEAIEKAAALDHWRPHYKLASQEVHAQAKPTYWNLAAGRQDSLLLVGQSDFGVTEALHPMLVSLNMVSGCLATQWPADGQLVLHMLVLRQLEKHCGRVLLSIFKKKNSKTSGRSASQSKGPATRIAYP